MSSSMGAMTPRWFARKGYDVTKLHLMDLHAEQEHYRDSWPLLAAVCPLTLHLHDNKREALESIMRMLYYRKSQTSELEDAAGIFDEIEERLAARANMATCDNNTMDTLSVERGIYGSRMISAVFGEINRDWHAQPEGIELRTREDLDEHLPAWYKRWYDGAHVNPQSAFEEYYYGEFARTRAEYTALYPALAVQWNLEIWSFGHATTLSVANCAFARLDDAAETLRAWNAWYGAN